MAGEIARKAIEKKRDFFETLARSGAFRDLDLAFSWHGGSANHVPCGRDTGVYSARFHFKGVSSHAGAAPERGRSALDAVELMNIGANYLREHVPSDVRIHYIITEGGKAPNTVPDKASSWYYVRALSLEAVDEVYQRLCRVAQGAAMMTDTEVEIQFVGGCHETLPNMTVAQLLYEALKAVDAPVWSEEELRFAETLNEQSPSYREAKVQGKLETPIAMGILPLTPQNGYGSTDVAKVMHIVPCAELDTATANRLAGGHNWQVTACAPTCSSTSPRAAISWASPTTTSTLPSAIPSSSARTFWRRRPRCWG